MIMERKKERNNGLPSDFCSAKESCGMKAGGRRFWEKGGIRLCLPCLFDGFLCCVEGRGKADGEER
jgi:hypothetical protein